ncbi:cytosine deaminase, partial [Mesorhizobium sp. M7D.F.Ca.US.004.03.1.1]
MIPNTGSYRLANVRLHASLSPGLGAAFDRDGFALADITVTEGKIAAISAHRRAATPLDAVDLGGRIVLPCFVDCHTHIDKGHIWPRKPNPDGTFMGA